MLLVGVTYSLMENVHPTNLDLYNIFRNFSGSPTLKPKLIWSNGTYHKAPSTVSALASATTSAFSFGVCFKNYFSNNFCNNHFGNSSEKTSK